MGHSQFGDVSRIDRIGRIISSPCIFAIPVDFAMKVVDLACDELGMVGSEGEDKRGAYADDVAERARNEEGGSVSLQQFKAAVGSEGLGLNVGRLKL